MSLLKGFSTVSNYTILFRVSKKCHCEDPDEYRGTKQSHFSLINEIATVAYGDLAMTEKGFLDTLYEIVEKPIYARSPVVMLSRMLSGSASH
ncbi:MAG: hypothetical protein QME51_09420 [Planctomycetota bacterium]|nr:hypothetical protein [Planctomycetota bacterium]